MQYLGPMKTITLLQPWATFVAIRAKRFETRSWSTNHRGPIAIHSGARPVSMDDLRLPGIEAALRRHCVVPDDLRLELFPDYLPLGQILCVANLIGVHRTEIMTQAGELQMTEEYYLGNYESGRYAWEMDVSDVFEPGIPARGAQGLWTYVFLDPLTKKEPIMAKEKKPETEKPSKPAKASASEKMDETKVLGEKGAIESAFSAPNTERAGVPSQPEFQEKKGEEKEKPVAVVMPDAPVKTFAISPDEFLPSFQKIVFIKFSREDLAVRAEQMAQCDTEKNKLEVDKAEDVKQWNDKIKNVEGKRIALSAQVTAKGEEREVECRKRINEETQEAIIFDAHSLDIIETKKITNQELQVEMRMAETHRAAAGTKSAKPKGAKVVDGNFPKDKVVGAHAAENPELDRKNEDALKELAGKKD